MPQQIQPISCCAQLVVHAASHTYKSSLHAQHFTHTHKASFNDTRPCHFYVPYNTTMEYVILSKVLRKYQNEQFVNITPVTSVSFLSKLWLCRDKRSRNREQFGHSRTQRQSDQRIPQCRGRGRCRVQTDSDS